MFKKVGIGLAALGAVLFGVYLRFIRPWQLRWGATDEEVARAMPGDDEVKHPTFNATRAVTIQARPEDIWPWLLQIGAGRAGWYTYDWLERQRFAERIIPEFQHLEVGDLIPTNSKGTHGPLVKALDPNRRLMLWGHTEELIYTWYWGLYPLDARQTRLITRVHMRYEWTSPMLVFNLLVEFADIVMMRKMLLSIKQRAEHASRQTREPAEIAIRRSGKKSAPVTVLRICLQSPVWEPLIVGTENRWRDLDETSTSGSPGNGLAPGAHLRTARGGVWR
jgi:hypothetical protein